MTVHIFRVEVLGIAITFFGKALLGAVTRRLIKKQGTHKKRARCNAMLELHVARKNTGTCDHAVQFNYFGH